MLSNAKLFSVGNFDFRFQHLLIIGILAIAVSTSALIRAQPAEYGFALHEFDPYFNFRATAFIVENGYDEYLEWHDDMSWYPYGRDVSSTSQTALHLITATMYNIFGGNSSLWNFTIMFPLVIGSLSCIVIFATVRVIGGTTAGLLASLMFAISLPIALRGFIGWYKSEPLGLFLGFIAIYLFLSAIKTNKGKITFAKLIFAGIFLSLGFASWGGIQFFLLPLAIFIIALPFFKKNNKFLFWAIPTFSISLALSTMFGFDRPGMNFILGSSKAIAEGSVISYGAILIFLPVIFMILVLIVQKFSSARTKIRNSLIVVGVFIASGVSVLISTSQWHADASPSFRYLNAINPFMSSEDPLISSVAEHQSPSLEISFHLLSIFIIFGLVGLWLLFTIRSKNSKFAIPNHMKAFAVIFGLIGIYTSSVFIRMEVFGSVALIVLGSLGLAILLQQVLDKPNIKIKFIFCIVIIGIFLAPLTYPEERNWVTQAKVMPTIFTGASLLITPHDDWVHAMEWLKNNTPDDSVVFTWWDWGYWIQTLGERTTLVDNSTLITWQIEKVARTFFSSVDDAWIILNTDNLTNVSEHYVVVPEKYKDGVEHLPQEVDHYGKMVKQTFVEITGLESDYVVLMFAGTRYAEAAQLDDGAPVSIYSLDAGGDEGKIFWLAHIAGLVEGNYMYQDGVTPTPHMMQNTLFGQMTPFSIISYYNPETGAQSNTWSPGHVPIYIKDVKLSDPDGPFTLVYASPSFYEEGDGVIMAVLIYKINHDYIQ